MPAHDREFLIPLPELSNSGCRPGKAGGSPPLTLAVFEKQAPFRVAESGAFSGLAEEYGLGEVVAAYPEDWRESLTLYRYCVLERAQRESRQIFPGYVG